MSRKFVGFTLSAVFGFVAFGVVVLAQPGFAIAQSNVDSFLETAPQEEQRIDQSTSQRRMIYQRAIERSRLRSMRLQQRKQAGKSMLRPTYHNSFWAPVPTATFVRSRARFGGYVWPTTAVYWR